MLLYVVCVVVFIGASWWSSVQRSRVGRMASKLPGPPAYPLVGNALQLGITTSDFLLAIGGFCKQYYGSCFRLWVGSKLYVVISSPKDLEIILSSNKLLNKGSIYSYLVPWLGTGLLISTGEKWRVRRRILTPTFHFKILDDFIGVFNANAEILVEKLNQQVGGAGFDVYNYIKLYTLDVLCETAMGVKINAQSDSGSEYARAVRDMTEIFMKRTTKPWNELWIVYYLSGMKKRHDKCLEILHSTTNNVIKQRRVEIAAEKAAGGSSGPAVDQGDGVKRRLAFLDMLIESTYEGSLMTDENIREEVDTFMFEGHDTTSSGISFALWLLSWHQDAQERVFQEVQDTFPDPGTAMTLHGLQDLHYLERVIKETLRLYPSVPMYVRELSEDVTLSDGHVAPKGTSLTVAAFMAHKNPEVFPDPEKFDPDRFLLDNKEGRNPYAYVPFSAGPRNCIGQKFAMLELKSVIAHVVRRFKLLPGSDKPDLNLALEVILISTTGIPVKVVPRV